MMYIGANIHGNEVSHMNNRYRLTAEPLCTKLRTESDKFMKLWAPLFSHNGIHRSFFDFLIFLKTLFFSVVACFSPGGWSGIGSSFCTLPTVWLLWKSKNPAAFGFYSGVSLANSKSRLNLIPFLICVVTSRMHLSIKYRVYLQFTTCFNIYIYILWSILITFS